MNERGVVIPSRLLLPVNIAGSAQASITSIWYCKRSLYIITIFLDWPDLSLLAPIALARVPRILLILAEVT